MPPPSVATAHPARRSHGKVGSKADPSVQTRGPAPTRRLPAGTRKGSRSIAGEGATAGAGSTPHSHNERGSKPQARPRPGRSEAPRRARSPSHRGQSHHRCRASACPHGQWGHAREVRQPASKMRAGVQVPPARVTRASPASGVSPSRTRPRSRRHVARSGAPASPPRSDRVATASRQTQPERTSSAGLSQPQSAATQWRPHESAHTSTAGVGRSPHLPRVRYNT